jgi:hypothetical protein
MRCLIVYPAITMFIVAKIIQMLSAIVAIREVHQIKTN